MQDEILFLTDERYEDALPFAVLCYVAQQKKIPITVITAKEQYHDRIRAAFSIKKTIHFFCRYDIAEHLYDYEIEQVDCQFGSLYDVAAYAYMKWSMLISLDMFDSLMSKYKQLSLELFHVLGLIDFGNFIAQKAIENIRCDLRIDEDVAGVFE